MSREQGTMRAGDVGQSHVPVWVIRLSLVALVFYALAVILAWVALLGVPAEDRSGTMWVLASVSAVGWIAGVWCWFTQRYVLASIAPVCFVFAPIKEAFLPGLIGVLVGFTALVILGLRALGPPAGAGSGD